MQLNFMTCLRLHREKRKDPYFMYFRPLTAFYVFAAAHTISAAYSPIQDCDEVFNFWEPAHYLDRGYGFQTWEYSPDYAIRSWMYAALHAAVAAIARIGLLVATKAFQFYFLRFALGLVCAACEARLYAQMSRSLNARIGLYFAVIMLASPGMFHASVSFLPSAFAMYMTMLGTASFMDWRGGANTADGMMYFGFAAVVAWPFSGALIIPFMAEEFLIGYYTESLRDLGVRIVYGTTRTVLVGALQWVIELMAYREPEFVPFNIVKYNVLSAWEGKGPNIFGTEPWHFYARNLFLNFNFWWLLALVALPLVYYQEFILRKPATKQSYIRNITFTSPMYLWLCIFTIQPHKEERFMYPIYPLIALNAAITIHILLTHLGSRDKNSLMSVVPGQVKFGFAATLAFGAILIGLLRMAGLASAYDAPLSIYKPLFEKNMSRPGDTVCLGKEWYRFPGHYHLPNGVKGKFIKSAFDGLLPGEFSTAGTGFGIWPGTWLRPPGMNDMNIEDPGKYVSNVYPLPQASTNISQTSIEHCHFLVDSSFPGTKPAINEPNYIADEQNFDRIKCLEFLDPARTQFLARMLWVPDWEIIPEQYKRQWGHYCLLRQKKWKA